MAKSISDQTEWEDDPSFIRSRREAFLILGLWLACFLYCVPYCYINGYLAHEPSANATGPDIASVVGPLEKLNREPGSVTYPFNLGIPDWVFWGVVAPWGVCILLTVFFCLFIYAEDDLGTAIEDSMEK